MYVSSHSENSSTITSCGTRESSEEILTQPSSFPKKLMAPMMVLSKFPWVRDKGNRKPPIPLKAIEELTLKYSLMNMSSHLPISLLFMNMPRRLSLYLKRQSFVTEWRRKLAVTCRTILILDRLRFGITNYLILTMKLNHC